MTNTSRPKFPLGRVVNDARVEDHHAIIPTKSEHDLSKMGPDESRIYDLVAKRGERSQKNALARANASIQGYMPDGTPIHEGD